eukprot:gnl/TRDRNA2_/TRDRNA2_176501_c0_seq1.p1 gnl/TRDRNA2_/TRDRNA2_176501_c0~~gnl/TRDRNA2_/TRDRNA2_176501_c0_seq1.p1  ORF type:complete len:104 (+),score=1.38 gnl/TRDRNA2_/TRDRNA2_176501_c0_seq1:197-508(+)
MLWPRRPGPSAMHAPVLYWRRGWSLRLQPCALWRELLGMPPQQHLCSFYHGPALLTTASLLWWLAMVASMRWLNTTISPQHQARLSAWEAVLPFCLTLSPSLS